MFGSYLWPSFFIIITHSARVETRSVIAENAVKFVELYMKWKSPLQPNNNGENCLTVSFGAAGLEMPTLTLDLEPELNLTQQQLSVSTDNCFLVFIGGRYVEALDQVLDRVASISREVAIRPLALFIDSDDKYFEINSGNTSFPMVFNIFKVYLGNSSNVKPSPEKGFGFRIQCPGKYSLYPFKLILFNNGSVSKDTKYKEDEKYTNTMHIENNNFDYFIDNSDLHSMGVCSEEMSVRISKTNIPSDFEVNEKYNVTGLHESNYSMVEEEYYTEWIGLYSSISHDWEMLKSFFLIHNIVPTWIPTYHLGFWGQYDRETGDWDGAVGLIQRNEADLAMGQWQCTIGPHGPSHVAFCPPPISYEPFYWWTRYPTKRSKILNLIDLFTPTSWMWTFISIFSIVLSLKIATYVGKSLGLDTYSEEIVLFPYRLTLLRIPHSTHLFPKGFAFNILFLFWCVFGGFLCHMLLCNLLEGLIQPKFNSPVDTSEQLVDRNITVATYMLMERVLEVLSNSVDPSYRKIAETTYIPKSDTEYRNILKYQVLTLGTHAMVCGYMHEYDLHDGYFYNDGRGFYRSKDIVMGINPYNGHLTSKKWVLNEGDLDFHYFCKDILLKLNYQI